MNKFILFLGDGINALGIARSLGAVGLKPVLISLKESSRLVRKSRYISKIEIVNSAEDGLELVISKYGDRDNKPFVYFTDDYSSQLFNQNYNRLINICYFFNANSQDSFDLLLNKGEQCRLASSCGLVVPQYYIVQKGEIPDNISYPIITKSLTSNMGGWKKDVFICHNEEELKEAYSKISASQLILEQYINKKCEMDLKGFSVNSGKDIFISYISQDQNSSEKTQGSLKHYSICSNCKILDSVKELIRKAHYSGIFDAEFIMSQDGQVYFMEINWRSGMSNYAHFQGGINLPILWAESTLKKEIEKELAFQANPFSVVNEISDFSNCVLSGKMTISQWLKELKSVDYLTYYDKYDIYPCIIGWKEFIFRKIQNKIRRIWQSISASH